MLRNSRKMRKMNPMNVASVMMLCFALAALSSQTKSIQSMASCGCLADYFLVAKCIICAVFFCSYAHKLSKSTRTTFVALQSSHRMMQCSLPVYGWFNQRGSGYDFSHCSWKCMQYVHFACQPFLPWFWPNRHGFRRCLLSCCWVSCLV